MILFPLLSQFCKWNGHGSSSFILDKLRSESPASGVFRVFLRNVMKNDDAAFLHGHIDGAGDPITARYPYLP